VPPLHRSIAALCAAPLAVFAASDDAAAQSYPVRPIRLVVPNAPGGGSDSAARIVAEKLSPALGQQIIVDNRGGAGGRLAAEFVANAAPDGYTLLLGTGATLITAKALYANLKYDPVKSFAPISMVGSTAYVLVVHPSVPAKNVKQLVAIAKAKPDALTYATTGPGSPAHLAGELFQALAGAKLIHVPFKGSAPGTLSIMQGETDIMFSNLVAALPHLDSGRLRALGISSRKRSSIVPSMPTIAESGLPTFVVEQFYSVVAPAGTPAPVLKRLHDEIVARIPAPDTKKIFEAQGTEVTVSSPEELARLTVAEIDKWTAVVRKAGIKPE
jgi:tripartite-type tricarboxylate transporter receptor subunit TctC